MQRGHCEKLKRVIQRVGEDFDSFQADARLALVISGGLSEACDVGSEDIEQ